MQKQKFVMKINMFETVENESKEEIDLLLVGDVTDRPCVTIFFFTICKTLRANA